MDQQAIRVQISGLVAPTPSAGMRATKEDIKYIKGTGIVAFNYLGKKRIRIVDKNGNSKFDPNYRYDTALKGWLRDRGVGTVALVYTMHRLVAVEIHWHGSMEYAYRVARSAIYERHFDAAMRGTAHRLDQNKVNELTDRELTNSLTKDEVYALPYATSSIVPRLAQQQVPGRVTSPPVSDTKTAPNVVPAKPVVSGIVHTRPIATKPSNAEVRRAAEDNIGCLFVLEELESGDQLLVHLRRYPEDKSPMLPSGYVSTNGDARFGAKLLACKGVGDEFIYDGMSYRIIKREPYSEPAPSERYKRSVNIDSADVPDQAKHADGHMAREGGRWGSFPMHDQYSDESTGEERDYEDWAEYVANY